MSKRGLGGVAYNKQDLKAKAKACGSYYFTPGSMRFFNARLLAVYPSKKRGVTYFVEAKGGEKDHGFSTIPRHYQVGVFKGCQVQSIGKGIGRGKNASGIYKTAAQAKKVAAAIAKKADTGEAALKRRRKRR